MNPTPGPLLESAVRRFHARAGAERWGLTLDHFQHALDASIAHRFAGGAPSSGDLEAYVSALHLDDLALASACAEGLDAAWDHFVEHYRPRHGDGR